MAEQHHPERVGLLANRSLRCGPDSPLIRFVREFESYFREKGTRIYALEGTYRAILRNGLFHDYEDLYVIPAGYAGGLVNLTAMVIKKDPPRNLPCLDTVIYFIDPRDPTSVYPESIALKRECVVANTTFIPTYSGAREWATLQWCIWSPASPSFVHTVLADEIFAVPGISLADGPMTRQTVALVAHDEKKKEMLEFARQYLPLLKAFDRRLATGTTGTMLNGREHPRLPRAEMKQDLRAEFDAFCQELESRGATGWVSPEPSGPRGGDVQIAEAVLNGKCHKIIFFEDPHVSRPHEADIQLLERTSRIPGQDIMCLHDFDSAVRWAQDRDACRDLGVPEPLTVVRAFRLVFGVDLVLANSSTESVEPNDLWKEILGRAAWYIVSLLSEIARERALRQERACVAVTWGYSMHEMVLEVERVPELLKRQDNRVEQKRSEDGKRALEPKIADERFFKPGHMEVIPMVGIMGTTEPRVEANRNAARLAASFGGKARFLPDFAFVDLESPSEEEDFGLDWDKVDVAIFTCDTVKENFGRMAVAPMPWRLHEQMKKAAGEVGGLFLDRRGEAIPPLNYRRVGMRHDQLRAVAEKKGAILIAGVDVTRVSPVLSVLRGRLASTLVTDLKFALDILNKHFERNL